MQERICGAPECGSTRVVAKGLCRTHYNRQWRSGSVQLQERPELPAECAVEGCRYGRAIRGLCRTHAYRLKKFGTTDLPPRRPKAKPTCSVQGCGADAIAKRLCGKHYHRLTRSGSVDDPVRTPRPMRICGIASCGPAKRLIHGVCDKHYQRKLTTGSYELAERPSRTAGAQCSVVECAKQVQARDLCSTHYSRLLKHGSTDDPRPRRAEQCRHSGCDELPNVPGAARGLCRRHYSAEYRDARREPRPALVRTLACSASGCAEPQRCKGYCAMHYRRVTVFGGPDNLFTCSSCGVRLPGRANTIYCSGCRPSPHEYTRRRKALLASNNAGMTATDLDEAASYRDIIRNDPCIYCGGPANAVDHINPVISGGSDRWDNLAPACKRCNSSKRTRPLLTFLLARLSA